MEPLYYDTLGTTLSVLIKKPSLFLEVVLHASLCKWTVDSLLTKEVSLFRRSLIERFHCIIVNVLVQHQKKKTYSRFCLELGIGTDKTGFSRLTVIIFDLE